jgi:hypothetical protein
MRAATVLFLALAACSKSDPKPPPEVHSTAPDARGAMHPAAPEKVQGTSAPPKRAALRCRLHGDPLARACDGPWGTIAVDGEGRLHVVAGEKVRRYRRAEVEGCEMEREGEVAVPVVEPKGQVVGEGPLYMQSGGPQWKVTATGGRVFLHEYLRGIHEIVGDEVRPVCPGLQGAGSIAIVGKQAYLGRNDGEKVTFGKTCKTASAGFEPRPGFGLHAVGDLLVGEAGEGAVIYGDDRKQKVEIGAGDAFAPGGICAVMAVVPCGDDVCVADGNCKKLNRYTRDGAFVAELDSSAMFDRLPVGMYHAAAGPDGLYLLVGYRDGDVCEDAVYLLPAR